MGQLGDSIRTGQRHNSPMKMPEKVNATQRISLGGAVDFSSTLRDFHQVVPAASYTSQL